MTLKLRTATNADQALIERALYSAWQWRHPWDERSYQAHLRSKSPDSYVDDFGDRRGDTGVIAEERSESASRFAGAAWYRFFVGTHHRPGFVAEDVPELVVAVEPWARGRGLGKQLLQELIELATTRELRGLSLHVSNENTVASELYRSLGFDAVRDHERRGAVMFKQL